MTAPVIQGIQGGLRPDGFGVTATTLLGCPRKYRLMQCEPYALKPSESWWAYRGQLMHGVSESYAGADAHVLAETRFSMLLGHNGTEMEISGQPDLVYLDRAHLVDYKTTKRVPGPWRVWTCPETGEVLREAQFAWRNKLMDCPLCGEPHAARAIERKYPPRPYPRHAAQLNLYALLLAENGVEVESAEVVYQSMAAQLRLPVELWPLDETRALAETRLALFLQPDLPGVLSNPTELWECDYCPVRGACELTHGGPVGKAACTSP